MSDTICLVTMKVQINCGVTKDRKIKGRLIRSKKKVEPEYAILKDMVVNSLDVSLLNQTHAHRICRDLGLSGEKLKEALLKKRVQIISIEVTKEKLGLASLNY